ncbi:site-specific DNA-methyltransferase [Aliivibrio fischeri]|uniref:site-specific DNA-methyltransferase (adenine-specific) n=1 Tax=Aliivibrio fischeri TaxID=668 RepID=A0A844P5F6_ALIFS|nr:site-specific DNA-methyltransferase [Aliivibrio fischeri]MUK50614.1 site-specific DNA-methyltransferase [Aliivibrio fischeri]
MDKLKMHSPNLVDQNIDKLAQIFPNCVTEAKGDDGKLRKAIDFDLLKQEVSRNIVEGPQERYQLNWPGKREALLTANAPIAKTLRPCREESVNFDTTENLFIEGDNLDALKLLQETYLGKVKMIYIDPPYNTGKDFIYEDDFAEDIDIYIKRSNQKDDQGNRLVANSESNGRFHSDWLSMIYSRLRLAHNLLRDDGVIFISIDENEQANLKSICDEVFGEDSFVECISWNKRIPQNDKGIGNIHEYVLIYVNNRETKPEFTMRKEGLDDIYDLLEKCKKKSLPVHEAEKEIRKLYKKNGYDRGITLYNNIDNNYNLWGKINMSWPNANTFGPDYDVLHPKTGTPVKVPDRGWRWKKETFQEAAKIVEGKYSDIQELHDGSFICGKIWFSHKDDMQPSSITYLDEVNRFLLRSILSLKSDGGIEVERIFEGKSYFSYPKPTSLLKTLLGSLPSDNGDIVLDFFAGSGTTAAAVMMLNEEDGIQRNMISVQLPESLELGSPAHAAGFENLAKVTLERIRRTSAQLESTSMYPKLDRGLRVLKIDDSNMAEVYYSPNAVSQADLFAQIDNVKEDRTEEDLLFQVMLDWGVDLTLPIRRETIDGNTVFFVADNALVACFDKSGNITESFVKQLAEFEPMRLVFRDAGFASDSTKINVEQVLKQLSPTTEVKSI